MVISRVYGTLGFPLGEFQQFTFTNTYSLSVFFIFKGAYVPPFTVHRQL